MYLCNHTSEQFDSSAYFEMLICVFSDDLMSLLDAGVHSDHPNVIIDSDALFNEDMFGYSALRGRSGTSRARSGM